MTSRPTFFVRFLLVLPKDKYREYCQGSLYSVNESSSELVSTFLSALGFRGFEFVSTVRELNLTNIILSYWYNKNGVIIACVFISHTETTRLIYGQSLYNIIIQQIHNISVSIFDSISSLSWRLLY